MLAIVIILSLILLGGAYWAARPAPEPVRWGIFVTFAIATVVLPFAMFLFPTVVVILAICLAVALGVWQRFRHRIENFLPLAGPSVVVAYGLACAIAAKDVFEFRRLREKYHFESMEDRVSAPAATGLSPDLADDGRERELESILDEHRHSLREDMLRKLHDERVEVFTRSPGFGVQRMLMPAGWGLRLRERPAVPGQPGPGSWPTTDPPPSVTVEPDLLLMHKLGTVDFVNPLGFGYVKDRRHVAGFQSHAFTEVPGSTPRWHVERLDLIGLLLHPGAVAYVSDKLPAMDELRGAPTRKLDAFEVAGLEALRAGQTLYLSPAGGRPRMLGAVRNVRQCVGCHGGQRGDLLGAFSYTLGPVADRPQAPDR